MVCRCAEMCGRTGRDNTCTAGRNFSRVTPTRPDTSHFTDRSRLFQASSTQCTKAHPLDEADLETSAELFALPPESVLKLLPVRAKKRSYAEGA